MKNRWLALMLFCCGGLATAQKQLPLGTAHTYKTVDGRAMQLWVVMPANHTAKDHSPAIVFYHGGGWTGGGPEAFNRQASYLATRGMVAVLVDYRMLAKGSPDPLTVCLEDAKSSFRWVRGHAAELGIDPHRIAASGGSAGGQLTGFLGLITGVDDDPQDDLKISATPDALVMFNPALDLKGCCEVRQGGGDKYKEIAPFDNVHAGAPPMVIMQGAADTSVSPEQAKVFAEKLKAVGVRCDLVLYPGEVHGFFNSGEAFYQTLEQTDRFLASLHWIEGPPDVEAIRKLPSGGGKKA